MHRELSSMHARTRIYTRAHAWTNAHARTHPVDGNILKWSRVAYLRSDIEWPDRVAQSVGHLTRKSGVLGSIPGLATYFRFSFRFFKKGSCQLLAKYVHEVLVNRLGGLSLPRKSVV